MKIDQASLGRHKLQQFFLSRTTITNTNWHLIPTILRSSHERAAEDLSAVQTRKNNIPKVALNIAFHT